MTQEEKARAYDEALEKATTYHDNAKVAGDYSAVARYENIFPELAESEDERIRKELIAFFQDDLRGDYWHDLEVGHILAWLEKQKEQKFELCDMGRWDEESYNNGIHHVLQNPEAYGLTKQKPAEWSEKDEEIMSNILAVLIVYINYTAPYSSGSGTAVTVTSGSGTTCYKYQEEMDWLFSIRERFVKANEKPSES